MDSENIDPEFESFIEPAPQILGTKSKEYPSKLLNDLIEIASKKYKPADFVVADLEPVIKDAREKEMVYCDYGSSLYIPKVGRYIKNWEGAPWSRSQLAKAYIDLQDWDWEPFRLEPADWWLRNIGPIQVFKGAQYGEFDYVDLRYCYWQIGQKLPWWIWDLEGTGNPSLGLWKRAEELNSHREIRLNLWGMLTYPGGGATWVHPDGTFKEVVCPPLRASIANPVWGKTVLAILHAFVFQLMATFPEIPLFHTDGALVPSYRSQEVIGWIRNVWNLESAIKESGSGWVIGAGNYQWRKTYRPEFPQEPHSNLFGLDSRYIFDIWRHWSNEF